MPPRENKALVHRFIEEMINQKDVAVIDQFFAANYVEHNPPPGQSPNLEGTRQGFNTFMAVFPDCHFTIEDTIAEGDKVVVRGTFRGTHQGELMGLGPTGKQVTVSEVHIMRVVGGKIVEHWGQEDALGLMQQLGVIPAPGQGGG